MVAEKSIETGHAIAEAVERGRLISEAEEGRVAFTGNINFTVLEASGLFHDTGMCGGGYALTEITDEEGRKQYATDENGRYQMHPEDSLNFAEIRSNHSLNSGLYLLVNREGLEKTGFSDAEIDRMAVSEIRFRNCHFRGMLRI